MILLHSRNTFYNEAIRNSEHPIGLMQVSTNFFFAGGGGGRGGGWEIFEKIIKSPNLSKHFALDWTETKV